MLCPPNNGNQAAHNGIGHLVISTEQMLFTAQKAEHFALILHYRFIKLKEVKKSHIIVLFLIAICIGVFASKLGNVASYSSYEDAKIKEGETVQLIGTLVKEKPVNYDPQKDANSFSFTLLDRNGKQVDVVCFDDYPRDFEKCDQIVLTGAMKDNTFYAKDMLVKCPSKYVQNEIDK